MPRPPAYKLRAGKDVGKIVPGTTTPINKWGGGEKVNNLCSWAQGLACNYEVIDGELWHVPKFWQDERDARGAVGTYTHALWSNLLDSKQELPNDKDYEQWQIDEATIFFGLLRDWLRKNPISPLSIEEPLVSHKYQYGGTPDVIDQNYVIDVKTGFVNEFSCMLQLSSYDNLAYENGLTTKPLGGIILQPYNKAVRPYYYSPKTLGSYFPTFLCLLQAYNDEKSFNYMRRKKR
jgi:hypothetical protein